MEKSETLTKLANLIQGIPIAMMTTVDAEGYIHSRPMANQEGDLKNTFDGTLWFLTGGDSGKVHELKINHQVNLVYSEPKSNSYISISGECQTIDNRTKARELWNPIYKAWFPKGMEDPNLKVLKVTVHKAEYWASHSSTAVQVFGYIKALATGKPSHGELSDHDKINLAG